MYGWGDLDSSSGLLNQMLDYLTYQFRQKPEIVRSRLTELIALISRTIISFGANEQDVLTLSHQQVATLYTLDAIADMRAWTLHSFAEPRPSPPPDTGQQAAMLCNRPSITSICTRAAQISI